MTHEEFVSRLEAFGDSPEEVEAVLGHVGACDVCSKEQQSAKRWLAKMESSGRSRYETVLRWTAAAVVAAVVVASIHHPVERRPPTVARYRLVGDASGVVAYTPEGIVVGTAGPRAPQELR
jgi:hypothetical protein